MIQIISIFIIILVIIRLFQTMIFHYLFLYFFPLIFHKSSQKQSNWKIVRINNYPKFF
jgi:hypothetical protein